MRRSARQHVALLWQGLAQAFLDARVLRHLSLDQAHESYRTARANSRVEHGAALHQIVDRYKLAQARFASSPRATNSAAL